MRERQRERVREREGGRANQVVVWYKRERYHERETERESVRERGREGKASGCVVQERKLFIIIEIRGRSRPSSPGQKNPMKKGQRALLKLGQGALVFRQFCMGLCFSMGV